MFDFNGDEQCTYTIGQDEKGKDIVVPAIRKVSGVWIENGTMLVDPTPEWIAENQPEIEPVPQPKTELEIIKEALDDLILNRGL